MKERLVLQTSKNENGLCCDASVKADDCSLQRQSLEEEKVPYLLWDLQRVALWQTVTPSLVRAD